MGFKDRFFGRFFGNSKKQPDEIDNPPTIDIQYSPEAETTPEAKQGFFRGIWNKFGKDSHSDQTPKLEAETVNKTDIEPIYQEVETEINQETNQETNQESNQESNQETNQETNKKNRFQSILQKLFRKKSDLPVETPTQASIEEVKPQVDEQREKTNPNKLKQLFNQLTQKEKQTEKEEIQTEKAIEKVEENLENTRNSGKIKNIFHKLVKSANPQDIQKITEKLPQMNRGPIKEIWPKIQSLFQMVLDPNAAWTSKALAIGSLVYLISPFDAIPDIIPIAGLTDDAALIVSVFSVLAFELSRYAKQSIDKGVQMAQELADIEVRKYNRIVRITLIGSIVAAILAIAVKIILKNI